MRVRCLCGAYAGTVRDFPSHIAKMLIANGRAKATTGEDGQRQAPVERAVQAAPEQAVAVRPAELAPPRKIGGRKHPRRLRK
jgi:hypothetical protein